MTTNELPVKDTASGTEVENGDPVEWKRYRDYHIKVDPDNDDKATEIKFCSVARPHMRAFHMSWWGNFIACFIWFAATPLLSEIKDTLKLSKEDIWTSNIVAVSGTAGIRFVLGPLCDKYGPRILYAFVLFGAAIPCACTGLIHSSIGLSVVRFFIGTAGGTFVMCQYWTSRMFTKEIAGTANALVGGWGNLGGGVAQILMGSVLFPLFKSLMNNDSEMAWRTVFIVPAVATMITAVVMYYMSEDAPKGNYGELKKYGSMPEISAASSFRSGSTNFNSWLLFVHYACTFGVQLTFYNAAALYFKDEFGLTTERAAAIASIFGWMNVFTRATGGFVSDVMNARMGMRGRLLWQTILLLSEGVLILIFGKTKNLTGAIVVMVCFSCFCQAGCGSTYGIVPYVDPSATGSISGIVGAGGSVGGICFGLAFRQLGYGGAFALMGWAVVASSLLSVLISIKGHSSLLWGTDKVVQKSTPDATLALPEQDVSTNVDVNTEDDIVPAEVDVNAEDEVEREA